ncbi:aromatic acid/H+ symport family MFS transporter [Advenella sp. WQ 585]|uniref:Aromatic acid/H+ symport family MFS transporter n=1 Tax=Advenella mandrilli TaxID=2800330 RepID=A0ABS1EBZ6_9BURK|nr:aromatic acid/H+ symport family MFS transporter [Advenella mandrilli]MBK1780530.1 aromatic acid/H+ symport family MFS transporter [Advenella mandrilli]
MSQDTAMDAQQFIDKIPFSFTQKLILALCFLVVAIDGFDTAAIGFIAPALKAQWQLSPTDLAPLFGAGLFGLMTGALFFGPLADKYGRKPVLIWSVFVFGLSSLVSGFSPDMTTLIVLRFITGLGLGGAMPNAITITSEYCPSKTRSTLVTLMFCGFTLGSALGGLVSAQLLTLIDWHGILILGGVLPLLLLPFLILYLPESLRFMVLKKHDQKKINKTIKRIAPHLSTPTLVANAQERSNVSIRDLFSPQYAKGTILIWISYFMSLVIIYLFSSWMPTLLTNTGASLQKASLITSVFQIGGTAGAILLGFLMDRVGASKILTLAYVLGAVFLILCGQASSNLSMLVIAIFGLGITISGCQVGMNAFCSSYYPTHCRSTGVSWANAVGRSGSVFGSIIGGWLMSLNLGIEGIMSILAIPALLGGLAIFVLGKIQKQDAKVANVSLIKVVR